MSGDAFFLQYLGGHRFCALFERAGRKGYTMMLDQAGIFTRAEAEAAVKGAPERRMLPVGAVLPLVRNRVDFGDLEELNRKLSKGEVGA